MLKFPFLPQDAKFFDLFEDGAGNIVAASRVLKDVIDKWENVEARVEEITELEHRGDSITHETMSRLHKTFVTPFDREDIAALIKSIDDVMDFIDATARAMLLYKVNRPGKPARELAEVVHLCCAEVETAVKMLRHKANLKPILNHCVELNRLENMADVIYRSAVAQLFEDSSHLPDIIKWREIYEQLESATDRCEDVANVLEGVALKHA